MHWIGIRENGGEPDFDNYHKHFDFVAKSWPLRPLHFTESRGEKHNNALLIWMGSGLTLQSSAMQRGLLKGQRQFQNQESTIIRYMLKNGSGCLRQRFRLLSQGCNSISLRLINASLPFCTKSKEAL